MKKSVGSFIGLNRRPLVLLGVVLSLAVFSFITSQISAKDRTVAEQQQEKNAAAAAAAPQAVVNAGPVKDGQIITGRSYKNDTSIPLRDMRPEPYTGKPMDREANENPKVPHFHIDVPDEAI